MLGREAHKLQRDIHDTVLEIKGQLNVISARNQTADLIHQDHEKRIRALEVWRYGFPVSTIAGLAGTILAIYSILRGH